MSPTIISPVPLSPIANRTTPLSLNSPPVPSHPPFPSSEPPDRNHFDNDISLIQPYVSEKTYNFISQNLGLVLVGAATFFFASMNLLVKYFLSITTISVPTLIAVRMVITGVCCNIALLILGDPHPFLGPPEQRRMLALRGLVGFVGLSANYQSFKGLSVSDSTSIQYLSPSVTTLLGFLLLGEKSSFREVIGGVACLGGVVLISRPPFIFGGKDQGESIPIDEGAGLPLPDTNDPNHSSRMVAVIWALISVCGTAGAYIIIRRLGNQAHALHTIAYFAYLCSTISVLAIFLTPGPTTWVDTWSKFFLIILIGAFGFIAQMLLTLGLQRERVGRAGVALYLSVFFAIILELLFLHTFPSLLSLVGIAIILSSAFWVAKSSMENKIADDVESQPISRSPSPLPQGERTLRGQTYNYSSLPTKEEEVEEDAPKVKTRENGSAIVDGDGKLAVRKEGIQRRTSTTSSISGYTTGAASGNRSD